MLNSQFPNVSEFGDEKCIEKFGISKKKMKIMEPQMKNENKIASF